MLLKAHALSLVFLDQMCLSFPAALQADNLVISSCSVRRDTTSDSSCDVGLLHLVGNHSVLTC